MKWVSLCLLLVACCAQVAEAVIVAGSYSNSSDTAVNVAPPADDPGFYNVGKVGSSSAIYLGTDSQGVPWVLSAKHVQLGATSFTFPDPAHPAQMVTGTYSIVNNSGIVLKNTTGPGAGQGSDLIMYKIDPNSSPYGVPNLPRLNIATAAPAVGDTVVAIGRGVDRAATPSYWSNTWQTVAQGSETFSGYTLGNSTTSVMRWGENRVSIGLQDFNVGTPSNPVYLSSYFTSFSRYGATANEFQATTGDSGGGVFEKIGGQWYLAGMMSATTLASATQPAGLAVFGTSTIIGDISSYRAEILAHVPEPTTLLLAIVGGAALTARLLLKRRRK